jgi:hypothetical protein
VLQSKWEFLRVNSSSLVLFAIYYEQVLRDGPPPPLPQCKSPLPKPPLRPLLPPPPKPTPPVKPLPVPPPLPQIPEVQDPPQPPVPQPPPAPVANAV